MVEWMLLVRYSEIALKGRASRRRMERLLVENIRDALASNGVKGKRVWARDARVWVCCFRDEVEAFRVAEHVARVMGVVSVSPVVEQVFHDLNHLVELGREFFKERVKGKVFAVRAHRVGEHDFTSKDVEKLLGEALLKEGARGVNLENPEYEAFVEIRWGQVYFYDKIVRGPGGLPVGSEGVVLSLFSGGIDSPVASWMMLKRGCIVHLLFFNIGGKPHLEGALRVAKVLADKWMYGYKPKLYVIDVRPIVQLISDRVPEHYRIIVLRRAMMRLAEKLALRIGAEALVTGESLGQVASQTLRNLRVIDDATSILVLRPLIGFDKQEIVNKAIEIGTYEESKKLQEYCALGVSKPTTRAKLDEARKFEEESGILDLIDKLVELAEEIDLRSTKLSSQTMHRRNQLLHACEAKPS